VLVEKIAGSVSVAGLNEFEQVLVFLDDAFGLDEVEALDLGHAEFDLGDE
jgi:hypothetical protein